MDRYLAMFGHVNMEVSGGNVEPDAFSVLANNGNSLDGTDDVPDGFGDSLLNDEDVWSCTE